MASCHTHAPTFLKLPPTDGTDQHRCLGGAAVSAAPTKQTVFSHRTHGTHRIFLQRRASHRCKLRGCSSLCCTNKANGILPQNARNAQNLLAEKSLPQMQAQGVQQSLLHQQSKRHSPTERTERTESSCREEPPTDGTDQHRSLGGAAPPARSSVGQHHAP